MIAAMEIGERALEFAVIETDPSDGCVYSLPSTVILFGDKRLPATILCRDKPAARTPPPADGAARIGAILVTLNPAYRAPELAHALAHGGGDVAHQPMA